MGKIPKYYEAQVQINLEVCDLEEAAFIEYRPASMTDNKEPILNVVHIKRDKLWFAEILPTLEKLWKEIMHYREAGVETHPMYREFWKEIRPKREITLEPLCLFVKDD